MQLALTLPSLVACWGTASTHPLPSESAQCQVLSRELRTHTAPA